jgi:hypothetical protein
VNATSVQLKEGRDYLSHLGSLSLGEGTEADIPDGVSRRRLRNFPLKREDMNITSTTRISLILTSWKGPGNSLVEETKMVSPLL